MRKIADVQNAMLIRQRIAKGGPGSGRYPAGSGKNADDKEDKAADAKFKASMDAMYSKANAMKFENHFDLYSTNEHVDNAVKATKEIKAAIDKGTTYDKLSPILARHAKVGATDSASMDAIYDYAKRIGKPIK